jgi:soluble lytic murein transglycosylase
VTRSSQARAHEAQQETRRHGGIWLALGILAAAVLVVALTGSLVRDALPGGVAALLYPLHYEKEIGASARQYGVDPYLVAAVAKAESGFNPTAKSRVGATGLMQLMPETAAWIVSRPDWFGDTQVDLTDPETNLDLGAYYLSYLLDRFGGGEVEALAAYNAGEGTVSGWLSKRGGTDSSPGSLTVREIPFPETRSFVERVQHYRSLYRKDHPDAFALMRGARWLYST